jgi:hypothetical protein
VRGQIIISPRENEAIKSSEPHETADPLKANPETIQALDV